MSTLKEAAQQALMALEDACGNRCNAENNPCYQRIVAEVLRAALAQPQPVATYQIHSVGFGGPGDSPCPESVAAQIPSPSNPMGGCGGVGFPSIQGGASSHQEKPEPEPVALETVYETIIRWDESGGKRSRRDLACRIVSLFAAPPQRQPLTESEVNDLYKRMLDDPRGKALTPQNLFQAGVLFAELAHGIGGQP